MPLPLNPEKDDCGLHRAVRNGSMMDANLVAYVGLGSGSVMQVEDHQHGKRDVRALIRDGLRAVSVDQVAKRQLREGALQFGRRLHPSVGEQDINAPAAEVSGLGSADLREPRTHEEVDEVMLEIGFQRRVVRVTIEEIGDAGIRCLAEVVPRDDEACDL